MKKIIIDGYNVAHRFFKKHLLNGDIEGAREKTLLLIKKNFASAIIVWDGRRRYTLHNGEYKIVFSKKRKADNLIIRLSGKGIKVVTADQEIVSAVRKKGGIIIPPKKLKRR